MDKNDKTVAIRSRISSNFLKIIIRLDLILRSVAIITRSTQNTKSILSLIRQFCKFFIRLAPKYYIYYIIVLNRRIYKSKTRSNLRSKKKYNKNTIISESRRETISLYLLNQATTIRMLRS
jgi:hypothetical protein